jgi:hypothetical protein
MGIQTVTVPQVPRPAISVMPQAVTQQNPLLSVVDQPNQTLNVSTPRLLPPTSHGFVQLAANTSSPIVSTQLKQFASQLEQQPGIEKATVYKSIFPNAPFNLVVLIETNTVNDAKNLEEYAVYNQLKQTLAQNSSRFHSLTASNVRRLGDVDRNSQGLFIFNFFQSSQAKPSKAEIEKDTAVWDKEAVFFQQAGLNNSLLLAPVEGTSSDYTVVNHARWNQGGLMNLLWTVMTNPNLRDKAPNSMPMMYHMA